MQPLKEGFMSQSVSPNPDEWSKEQKEVWKRLTDHWEIITQGKVK